MVLVSFVPSETNTCREVPLLTLHRIAVATLAFDLFIPMSHIVPEIIGLVEAVMPASVEVADPNMKAFAPS